MAILAKSDVKNFTRLQAPVVVAQDKEAGILRIKAKARKDQAVGQDC